MRYLLTAYSHIYSSCKIGVLIAKCRMVVDVEPLKVAVSPSVGEIYAVAKISFNFFRSINGP